MTAERNGSILEVKGLSITFETDDGALNALRDVSFSIAPGETFGLAGESGSGKSSLAFAIMSYLPSNATVTAGRILFAGDDVLGVDERALRTIRGSRIAMVYQDPKSALDPSMRVGEQVAEALELHAGMSRNQALERALTLFELVNIGDAEAAARRYPHQLSGGMQQRVVIATALACDPELLIMDEPTTGLDVTTQARIIDLIGELKSKVRAALLFITHDLGVIAEVSDRVGILYAGELVEEGPKEALFRRPSHPYTRGLLAAIPTIERETRLTPIPGNLPDLTVAITGCAFAPRCGFVEARCRVETPALELVSEDQRAKCWRWRDVMESGSAAAAPARAVESLREEKVLTAENIIKHYDEPGAFSRWLGREDVSVKAVDGISMDVRSGEVFALVGESGCGKTTLGHCIIGLTSVTDGDITFRSWKSDQAGRRLETETELRRSAQMVFQHPDSSLNPMKTIRSILERPLIVHGTPRRERRQRAREILRWVNLEEAFLRRYPYQLSGGEKQRVAIARAFALEPEFVLLDEPVSSLDVSVQAAIINLLVSLKSEIGSAYLFISHDLGLVRTFANRVAVMYLGRLCELGPAKAVFDPPYHPYTRALLAAVPALDPSKRQTTVRLEGAVPSPRRPPSGCRFHTRCPNKIGRICEEVEPPIQEVGDGHWITCHIPGPELAREPPVWRRES